MKTPIQQAAAAMGRAKSPAKTVSSRSNGAKGGRPARQPYTVFSGEGEHGHIEHVTLTPIGLKRRLTDERCGGDRWAKAYYGHGNPHELQPVD